MDSGREAEREALSPASGPAAGKTSIAGRMNGNSGVANGATCSPSSGLPNTVRFSNEDVECGEPEDSTDCGELDESTDDDNSFTMTCGPGLTPVPEAWDSDDDVFSVKPGLEWWQAAFSLVVVVIGVGVMALPQLPNLGGFFPAVVLLVVCGFVMIESGMSMWKGFMSANAAAAADNAKAPSAAVAAELAAGRHGPPSAQVVSYEDLGRVAMGGAGEAAVVVIQVSYFLGMLSSYATLIAQACSHLDDAAHSGSGWFGPGGWMLVLLPLFSIMSLLPNITAIARLVPIAVASISTLVLVIVVKSLSDAQRWQEWEGVSLSKLHKAWPDVDQPANMGLMLATLVGAFGVVGNVPSVLCEMKDPMKFPLAYRTAMYMIMGIYLAVMCAGYYGYGVFLQGDLVASLTSFPANLQEALHVPADSWTGPKAVALEIVVSMLILCKLVIGFPLLVMVVVHSFQTCKYTRHLCPPGTPANKVMRISIPAAAILVAELIPDFGNLFGLVASLFGPPMQVFFPLLFGYRIRHALGRGRSSACRRLFHVVMVFLGATAMVVGTAAGVSNVISG